MAALEQWPQSGIPDNPGAWLMATAKHRAIDQLRRRQMAERRHDELGRRQEREHATSELDLAAAADDDIGDDMLSLLFATCHPMLSAQARAALTLRLFGGLSHAGDRPRLPRLRGDGGPASGAGQAHPGRGAGPAGGADRRRAGTPAGVGAGGHLPHLQRGLFGHRRRGLDAPGAVRGRAARGAHPGRAAADARPRSTAWSRSWRSRRRAPGRGWGPTGEPVLLLDQDRSRWDRVLIGRGLAALARAEQLGGMLGPYALQAAIAACHARAVDAGPDRLGADRGALRRARPAHPVAGGGAQPGGGGVDGLRARGGARARRRAASTTTRSATITCCPACGRICWRGWGGWTRPAPSWSGRWS